MDVTLRVYKQYMYFLNQLEVPSLTPCANLLDGGKTGCNARACDLLILVDHGLASASLLGYE